MNIRLSIIISCLIFTCNLSAQSISQIYKIDGLLNRIDKESEEVVVNFWATWCKPCVQELPAFDSLNHSGVKVLLVSIDFKEDIEKVNAFLKKNHIKSECVLLDEINGNDFIDKIAKNWTGAIPGTLFKNKEKRFFIEKKLKLEELSNYLKELRTK